MDASWGKKKKNYWEGDTADLEIGQEFEDAQDEEEEAKVPSPLPECPHVFRNCTNPPWRINSRAILWMIMITKVRRSMKDIKTH